ncbi:MULTISPECIES: sensor histidine kinase [unclassified Mesorhizobium]|uniref:sensor histidine kinase n=1 Tax=unclassified Mesorhizobium TaxID=325217 RepID=UPI001CC98DE6|nr:MULTISPECIES: CHASE3 domain-containing protein [unclassified Mesorhizobium]MBZ9739637.1 CHASE3 domain-containing protein [Mesorhizobium sp. CO1-1-4]MBZ9805100.1 CHASE3 domain-containing protein [Mesorhizobium sp. ES1-6]
MSIPRRNVVRFTSASLLIGFIALMAIVATNFWLGQRAQSYFDNAIAARDTRVAAVELRNALQTAEASERGFVITGNEIYLGPYQTAKAQAQRHLLALQSLLTSYPDSQSTLQRLTAIVAAKFGEFDQTIALKRDQRDAEIEASFRTNRGKALTDEANVFFSGIIGRADDRLTSGVAEQRANTGWLRLVSAIGGLVIVAVVAGAAYGAARYTRELRKTRDEVNALNSDLEQRVTIRTEDLAKARDRAEVLLSEVNHRVANSLALVSSLVNLQSKAVGDNASKDALAETQDRIFAISLVHRRLYSSSDVRSVALDEYAAGLLDHLRTSLRSQVHGVRLSYEVDPIKLETDACINLGVVVTELVTNAFKYAYPDGAGDIRVRLTQLPGEQAELVIEDAGIGKAEGVPARGTGVGSRIINAMSVSLGGKIEYRNLQPGTAAHLVFSTKPRRATAVL